LAAGARSHLLGLQRVEIRLIEGRPFRFAPFDDRGQIFDHPAEKFVSVLDVREAWLTGDAVQARPVDGMSKNEIARAIRVLGCSSSR
jgi:hypothetical protein